MTPVMTTIDYRVDNRIASATFTRPEKLNSISEEMVADLNAVLDLVEQDKGVRVLVLQGSGRAFCVGLDRDLLTRGFQDDDYLMSALRSVTEVFRRIECVDVPVIAVVDGLARAGGLEMLLACDIVVASTEAQIGDHHTMFGVMPGGGSTARLPRRVGAQQARRLIFTGEFISGEEAVMLGLAVSAVPSAQLEAEVEALVSQIVNKSRNCLAAVKRSIRRGAPLDVDDAVDVELEEFEAFALAPDSDAREGFAAYLEGRPPRWQ